MTKRMNELQPVVLDDTLLIKYSLDTYVRYYAYLLIMKS